MLIYKIISCSNIAGGSGVLYVSASNEKEALEKAKPYLPRLVPEFLNKYTRYYIEEVN